MSNGNIYHVLYEEFIEKAKAYYESLDVEGFGFISTNFSNLLDNRIEELVKEKLGKNKQENTFELSKKLTQKYSTARKTPIKTTIYSYDFIKGGTTLTESTHSNTLHIISIFCGYEDFDEYKTQYKVAIEKQAEQINTLSTISDDQNLDITDESKPKPEDIVSQKGSFISENRKFLIMAVALLLIGIIAISIKVGQKMMNPLAIFGGKVEEDTLREKITALMRNANEAEFAAYQTIPHSDTLILNKYFTDYALRRIKRVVKGQAIKQQYLKEPESKAYIISVNEINSVFKDLIEVKTLEYWDLIWYDENSKKPTTAIQYKKEQVHRYYVQRESDASWRIILDLYY